MTRTAEDLARLFAYGRWANSQTLASVAALDEEQFLQPIGGSFGSVQATLAHLYGADWVWLERWHGRSPRALPAPEELARFAVLGEKWEKVQDGQREFVESQAAGRMATPLTYVNFKGDTLTYPLGETLLHAVNHGTYHRGQVATLLRQLGKTPVSTDYLRYLDALAK
jgi:uncharacterized damage-inducible protein DinB